MDFQGNRFTVTFDGNKVTGAGDDSFADAGKVGEFTRSDSMALFDDLSYGAR